MASPVVQHYIDKAGLRGAKESNPRGLTILTGAVPGRAPGLGHMAPTYLCRFPGSALLRPARLRTFDFAVTGMKPGKTADARNR